MPSLGGVQVRTYVDEDLSEEYSVSVNEQHREAHCWIVSEAGKSFHLVWRAWSEATLTESSIGRLTIDGRMHNWAVQSKTWRWLSTTRALAGTEERSLVFAEAVEADPYYMGECEPDYVTTEIGTIILEVQLGEWLPQGNTTEAQIAWTTTTPWRKTQAVRVRRLPPNSGKSRWHRVM
ncbi:hypothetical protein CALCODRAFT_332886 [Calocera cornea HHB12733]|uniref:Uncharacterized protein n=1 Tax=Calocera cornea HHB12733 TaxID=1353952 RepID=A0A165F1H6_9BASI|nr:hypothetical protein CALCODRAFT_332886 [Calocera cornea HHB12733]